MTDPARETLTREAVLAASRDLIERDGLDNLSLRRVGAELGVTAPALYAYVTDKRDLLRGVAEAEFAGLLERFAAVDDPDPRQRLRQLSRAYVDYAAENPELFKTMFIFPPEIDFGGATGEELPIATQAFTFAVDSIRDAVAAGEIRDDLDPLLITFTSWVSTHGLAMVLNLGFVLDAPTRDLLIDLVLDTVLKGLEPDAG
ncbi:MAG: TetR/AcrR family transcriptional regulator [Acidimicrobiales bacterium]|nr:TetR/AcrR family transcriptional regulator [Acidimicrobiales bacterium]